MFWEVSMEHWPLIEFIILHLHQFSIKQIDPLQNHSVGMMKGLVLCDLKGHGANICA